MWQRCFQPLSATKAPLPGISKVMWQLCFQPLSTTQKIFPLQFSLFVRSFIIRGFIIRGINIIAIWQRCFQPLSAPQKTLSPSAHIITSVCGRQTQRDGPNIFFVNLRLLLLLPVLQQSNKKPNKLH